VPVILLTARRNREDIAYGLNLGADDYVQKPFDRGELLARIGVLLRLKRTQEELRTLNLSLEEQVRARTLELAHAYERLYLSEKLSSLGLLTAGIAHELNNPLSYVLSNVELIRTRLSAREALRNVRRARRRFADADGAEARAQVEEEFLATLRRSALYGRDAHDFREEVRGLSGAARDERFAEFLDWLEESAVERGGAAKDLFRSSGRLLESARDGLHRARGIVKDLSAFSHPGTEEEGPVDLAACVERTVSVLSAALHEREIRVETSLELDRPVRGVAGRIDQVILNLLQNAVHASGTGARIRIRTAAEDGFGRLEVEDEGRGIPAEEQSRVFDPFFTTKPVGEGTGLGLSICYRIVEGMAGEIAFRSEPGRGTTFVVRLPLDRAGGKEGT